MQSKKSEILRPPQHIFILTSQKQLIVTVSRSTGNQKYPISVVSTTLHHSILLRMKLRAFTLLVLLQGTTAFLFAGKRAQIKAEILALSTETQRGITATEEQSEQIKSLFEELEKFNPTPKPLLSPLINGDWSLDYSTSDSIVGKGGLPRIGPIVQTLDTAGLRAANEEILSVWGLPISRRVDAVLSPKNNQLTDVQFKQFTIGPVSFPAPERARGALDVTYLDEDFRLTRGDKGNLFVLTKL